MEGDLTQDQAGLAERIMAGDLDAESELVGTFGPRVFALLCARTRDRETARDLYQDVMLAVLTGLRRGQLRDAEKLPAYIGGVVRNLVQTELRVRRRSALEQQIDENTLLAAPGLSAPWEAEDERPRRALVRDALKLLNPSEREILLRVLVEQEKPAAIASALRLDPDVVRQRKSRAIKKIAEYVKKTVTNRLVPLQMKQREPR